MNKNKTGIQGMDLNQRELPIAGYFLGNIAIYAGVFWVLAAWHSVASLRASQPDIELSSKLKQAKFELFAKGPDYSEGPTWRDGELFFCSGALMHVAKDGRVEKYLHINPAGTVVRGDRHLLICDNKYKALLDLFPDGTLGVIADRFEGKPLNSLNDLTIDPEGNIYWTDPDGSSLTKPIGNIFRVRPDGTISKVTTGLAFPNGLDVDPQGKYLYVIESQSKKILRYRIPAREHPLGNPEMFFELGGSGGDGCAFDADGNFWVADFHRPETKRGRVTVLSPAAKVLGHLDVPAEVVSNLTFGGPKQDELFCTTGNPPGVFRVKVGVKGFPGHPGKSIKLVRTIPIAPEEPASPVHPRRFGFPGGIGSTRGWYIWQKFDPGKLTAEVRHEGTGEKFMVRVLPWATTYRYLVYAADPGELLPGERVNLFFSPDDKQKRGYLVHFQDELCQMKGHGHFWEVRTVADNRREFTARVMAGDRPLEDKFLSFCLAADSQHWRDGNRLQAPSLKAGDRVYMTWVYREKLRIVYLTTDEASLDALKAVEQKAVAERLAREGLGALVESVEADAVHLLVFPTFWLQANLFKEGQNLEIRSASKNLHPAEAAIQAKLVTKKNLGTYGSGATEIKARLINPADTLRVQAWTGGRLVRIREK